MRKVVRFGGALALLGVVAAGCSSSSYEVEREVSAQVRAANGAGMPGLQVTVWIVDVDLPGDVRQPMELEARETDDAGRVSWRVEAQEQPYICGFRVETLAGQELGYAPPDPDNRLSSGNGLAVITL